jgi:hypothetical protein
MPSLRGFLTACALALALMLAVGAAGASATSAFDIFADYDDNGVIEGDYSFNDLQAALRVARQDALYGDFASAVQDALDAAILGRSLDAGDAPADSPAAGEGSSDGLGSPLPQPRNPDERGQPPWPFLALTVLAGALVVTGAGSSIYRRARR